MPTQPQQLRIRALIEQRLGLAQVLQERVNLDTVLADLSGGDLDALTRQLQDVPDNAPAWQELIRALLIGETYFLRNRAHFDLLKSTILPDITARRRKARNLSLNIWSAGCATGEEAYSIAITLRDALPDLLDWNLRLVGSDLNQYALQMAQRGIYRNWSLRHTESEFQQRYFTPIDHTFQLIPLIRNMVTFRQHNLLETPPLPQFDIIFCCNVLLYFDKAQVYTVEDRIYEALSPGGWLILGQAEALQFKRERWATHIFPGAVVYQKPLGETQMTYYHTLAPEVRRSIIEKRDHSLPALPITKPSPALVQTAYAEAVQLMRVKHYDAAQQMLNNILAQSPDNGAARVLMGCLLANRGDIQQAHTELDRVLQADALQADAHYLKGVLYLEDEQTDAARESFRAAIYCRRGHPLAATILGNLYLQGGDERRAKAVWAEALDTLRHLAAQTPVSDLSDLTAEGVSEFLSEQIKLLAD